MSGESFQKLVRLVSPALIKRDTQFRRAVALEKRVVMQFALISIKLKISLRNSCVLYLYYHRIYRFFFTVILYMRILVGLFYFVSFFLILCSIGF